MVKKPKKHASHSFVKIISTINGENCRGRGITTNFKNMDETSEFVHGLKNADLANVKQIRIIPTEVRFSDPEGVSAMLDGIPMHRRYR